MKVKFKNLLLMASMLTTLPALAQGLSELDDLSTSEGVAVSAENESDSLEYETLNIDGISPEKAAPKKQLTQADKMRLMREQIERKHEEAMKVRMQKQRMKAEIEMMKKINQAFEEQMKKLDQM